MIIQFRNRRPRFIIKDDRWWISEERELVEIKDPDRTDDFQDKAREEKNYNNLLHYGHY